MTTFQKPASWLQAVYMPLEIVSSSVIAKSFLIITILIAYTGYVYAQTLEVPTGPFIQLNQYVAPPAIDNFTPNGRVAGLLPITHYRQCNQTWSSNSYGSGSCSTICSKGCALCCGTMVLKLNGVNVNPSQANSWLQNNSGYSGCEIKWAGTGSIDGYPGNSISWYGSVAYSIAVIKSEINAGNPVIARVNHSYGGSGTCGHFVVIFGYNNSGNYASDYLVADPGSSTFPVNWSYYTLCNSTTTPLRIYHNVTQQPCLTPSSVNASVTPTTAVLNWTSQNALSYNYFLKKSTASTYTMYSNYTYKPVQFSNLLPSTTYNFRVSINCSGTTSPQSATYTFTTPSSITFNGSSTPISVSDVNVIAHAEEINELSKISIFPNPVIAGEEIFITGPQLNTSVEFYSAESKLIFSTAGFDTPIKIPPGTQPGIYFIKIIDSNRNHSYQKIIVK